jgi:putative NIF3 family GTP cyclohydrolase 1 type 2
MVLPRHRRRAVLEALHAAHPYQQPAYDLHEQVELLASTGLGRVGELPSVEPLREFTARVARALPSTSWGVRAAGDPNRPIRRVAVCGGAGDSLLATVCSAGVDAYVTSDLRHHPVSEHLAAGGPALVDVAHWAGEWPWCAQAASVIVDVLAGTVDVSVSHRRTDPWTVGAAEFEGGPRGGR